MILFFNTKNIFFILKKINLTNCQFANLIKNIILMVNKLSKSSNLYYSFFFFKYQFFGGIN